jgi:hypothetical protein
MWLRAGGRARGSQRWRPLASTIDRAARVLSMQVRIDDASRVRTSEARQRHMRASYSAIENGLDEHSAIADIRLKRRNWARRVPPARRDLLVLLSGRHGAPSFSE